MTDPSTVLQPPATAGAAGTLSAHLAALAGSFLRGLPAVDLHTLRRVGAALHTFDALLDPVWAQELRAELDRLGELLGQERGYARRLTRLTAGLDSLTSINGVADARVGTAGPVPQQREADGLLARHPGAPKARALLERQLSLGRSRAHSAALQELGSARFHALADRMTLLVSDLPLRNAADRSGDHGSPAAALLPHAAEEARALLAAVEALPLDRATVPYTGDALHDPGEDEPWLRARTLVLRTQYALDVCTPLAGPVAARPAAALADLARILARYRDAADAADAAALAALTPRITPATAYVLGVVHADQRLEVEAARHTFSITWPDLYRSGWLTDAWLTNHSTPGR